MSDYVEHVAPAPQFRTVCRIGYWLHVDAMWNTKQDERGLTTHYVHFNLVGPYGDSPLARFGDTMWIGFCILTTNEAGFVVTDEDGEQFPDLETAIRHQAEAALKLEWQWTEWQDSQPSHPSKISEHAPVVAFTAREIAFAKKLATGDAD